MKLRLFLSLYQGTTSVVPKCSKQMPGFSPRGMLIRRIVTHEG